MSRLPNTATAAERREVHKAKMEGKRMNREAGLLDAGFTPSRSAGWRSFVRSGRA